MAETLAPARREAPTVLFLIRSLGRGGAERQLVELARGLDRRGDRVAVAIMYDGGPLERDLLDGSGIELVRLAKRSRWDILGFGIRLWNVVRTLRPHIVHGYLPVANELALFSGRLVGAKVVWGLRTSFMDFTQYDWLHGAIFRIARFFSRFPDLIILNSRAGRDYHASQGFTTSRMQVIPNGIDCDKFRPDPEARARIRLKWNIAPEVPLVGLVGRIDPMKDHRTFLEAVARSSRTDYVAVCVGGGADRVFEPLRTLARELGIHDRLHFVGAEGDMPGVYAALDILVSASIGEGFSNVIAEAMACGVPAVVTDVGDSAEIVGSTGIVVPPRSPDGLARGIEDLLDRRSPELSARARQRIVTNFTVDLMVDHTRSLLQALR